MVAIAPFRPGGQARQAQAHFSKEGCSVNSVEGVVKIYLQKNIRGMALSPVEPLAGGVNRSFSPVRDGHTDLEGAEQFSGRLPKASTKAL